MKTFKKGDVVKVLNKDIPGNKHIEEYVRVIQKSPQSSYYEVQFFGSKGLYLRDLSAGEYLGNENEKKEET